MTLFFDSSGIVKLYVPERQHAEVRDLAGPIIVAAVTRVEVASAFWRKHRMGEIDAGDAATLSGAFEADLDDADGRFAVIGLGPLIVRRAVESVSRHALRAYDAVQLATACVARDVVGAVDAFVVFDVALRQAALIEGFHVVPAVLDR